MDDFRLSLPADYYLRHMSITESTNTDALNWVIDGNKPKAFFIADSQHAGRGRRGRSWSSPVGNLYASLLVPCPDDLKSLGHYGFAISLAIYDAITSLAPDAPAAVKWPNDVLIDGGKCAGVLMEVGEGSQGKGLVIGFGLNILHAPEGTPYPVAKLADWRSGLTTADWASSILKSFFSLIDLPAEQLLQRWKKAAKGIGQPIKVNLPDSSIDGLFIDIADDGALLLQTEEGRKQIYAGDVFFPRSAA